VKWKDLEVEVEAEPEGCTVGERVYEGIRVKLFPARYAQEVQNLKYYWNKTKRYRRKREGRGVSSNKLSPTMRLHRHGFPFHTQILIFILPQVQHC